MQQNTNQPMTNQKVVGSCPKCGAPIYAVGAFEGNKPPANVYSCECRQQQKRQSARTGLFKTGKSTGPTNYY